MDPSPFFGMIVKNFVECDHLPSIRGANRQAQETTKSRRKFPSFVAFL